MSFDFSKFKKKGKDKKPDFGKKKKGLDLGPSDKVKKQKGLE